jgi:tetratricopeptide (TPR) repeat protein
MSDPESSLRYIERVAEQQKIIDEAQLVLETGRSRAILLYGNGGTGKTRLIRQLPKVIRDPRITCLAPIDVDDSQHWLLSNLERYVVDQLDPESQYFAPFLDYVSALPRHRLMPTSREAVLSHLNQVKAVFARCYKDYIEETGNSVVIAFDTTEAIRGMYLVRVFTEWIKALPGTLFILAGRPPASVVDWQDPIQAALAEPPLRMPVETIKVGEFNAADCREYLAPISAEGKLDPELTEKLVHLTQGHPLWLALTVDHVRNLPVPEEALVSLDDIRRDLPYHDTATALGRERAEGFKRHLVAPYKNADFWHEATKQLAIVRESVSQPIWRQLMADQPLPPEAADFQQAWEILIRTEWIRPRANRRYVTLHDALAEELAQRVINLDDPDERERLEQWRKAAEIYAEHARDLAGQLAAKLPDVDARLRAMDAAAGNSSAPAAEDEAALIKEVEELDNRRQELNQLRVAHLFYQLLCDPSGGARGFVGMMRQARDDHDVLFEDLLAFQMQRFLPNAADEGVLDDTIGASVRRFREWLRTEDLDIYTSIGLEIADYLIDREQREAARRLLDLLPEPPDRDPGRADDRYRLRNLQGNACLGIPGRARESEARFREALAEADKMPQPKRERSQADAYKELGFYYRNIGRWQQADESYRKARDAISRALAAKSPEPDRESERAQLASIHTNWAYLKGIGGRYDEGIILVESAIAVRGRLHRPRQQAISYSVKGEVYRYQRQFKEAWDAYAKARQLFEDQNSWSWLGLIYQEQAICLFQSIPASVQLVDPGQNPGAVAEDLIRRSLELCKSLNVRAYPSALNRAGRIFGSKNRDAGLGYLFEGAEKARELSDGWFWMANLVEYAELSYSAWSATGQLEYRRNIEAIGEKIRESEGAHLEFPELRGRWYILLGHLAMHDALAAHGQDAVQASLQVALDNYRTGFPLVTSGWVGSYGSSAIPREFEKTRDLAWKLRPVVRERWRRQLFQLWSSATESTTQLLPLLEELY